MNTENIKELRERKAFLEATIKDNLNKQNEITAEKEKFEKKYAVRLAVYKNFGEEADNFATEDEKLIYSEYMKLVNDERLPMLKEAQEYYKKEYAKCLKELEDLEAFSLLKDIVAYEKNKNLEKNKKLEEIDQKLKTPADVKTTAKELSAQLNASEDEQSIRRKKLVADLEVTPENRDEFIDNFFKKIEKGDPN